MLSATFTVLLPLFFVMGVGYFARRTGRIDAAHTAGIHRVLVEFTLPAALFTGTVQTARADLYAQAPLLGALLIAFAVTWLTVFWMGRTWFHHDAGKAALQASMVAFPNTGFIGVPVLSALFGASAVVTVALATVVGMLLFIPATVIVLEMTRHRRAGATEHSHHARVSEIALPAFLNAARAPLVWAPVLAAGLVLAGIGLPQEILNMLNLLGGITVGLAMFAAGLTLATYPLKVNFEIGVNSVMKMLAQPLLMLALVSVLGIAGTRAQEGVILCALPTGILATLLAARYETYRSEASSTLVLTSLVLMATLPLWRLAG